MDLIGIAEKLHGLRQNKVSPGRTSKLMSTAWEDLTEKQVKEYLAEIQEMIEVFESIGYYVGSYNNITIKGRSANPLKVVRKSTGKLHLQGG